VSVTDFELTPIDGGYSVRPSADGRHRIDVLRMLYGWRLVTTPTTGPLADQVIDKGWCYFGHGPAASGRERTMRDAFRAAVLAAYAWDGADDTEPVGYDKAVGS
jgi:hypothetical protein